MSMCTGCRDMIEITLKTASNSIVKTNQLTNQTPVSMTPRIKAFENIMGKGENAGDQHFHLLPQCFLSFP